MKRLFALITSFVLITLPNLLLAQPGLPDTPEQTPIDGGLGILAALGTEVLTRIIHEGGIIYGLSHCFCLNNRK